GVKTGDVVVTAGLNLTTEAVGIVTEARTTKQETFLLREITEGREGNRVVLVRGPSHFPGIERGIDLVVNWIVKLLGQEVVLALLGIESAKEPNLVLSNWSTYVNTGVDFGEAVRRRAEEGEVVRITNETLRRKVTKCITMEFITTTLGDDVENTTRAATILGTIGTSLDLDFLHKLERQVRTRTTESGVSRVHTIKDVVVLWTR